MSISAPEPAVVAAERQSVARAAQNSDTVTNPSWKSISRPVRILFMSIAVWTLYVPHHTVLWLLGPRLGMHWARFAARIHWLLSFAGAQRAARRTLLEMAPLFRCRESVSEILLKHLELKHECFARVRVYGLQGADIGLNSIHWEVDASRRDVIPEFVNRGRGLIVVGFHVGYFQMSAAALSQMSPGCDPLQLRFRAAQCVEHATTHVANIAIRKAMEADQRSGATIQYIDGNASLLHVLRVLRRGGCVAVAADGMLADEFVEVPFLDGFLRVPSGWARIAAITQSDVLVVFDRHIDHRRRRLSIDDRIRCEDSSTESVKSAVALAVHILEEMVRMEPWNWHPWSRLRKEMAADGLPRYYLQQFFAMPCQGVFRRGDPSALHVPVPPGNSGQIARDTERPRVAVICNSLTPYRVHLHERIVAEAPEIELWSLATHGNAYDRWSNIEIPQAIRPVHFGGGEPTNEQTKMRYSVREWRKAGRIIRWLREHQVSAVLCQGCGDIGRMRILKWCHRNGIPCFLTGDFNVQSDRQTGIKRWVKRQVYQQAVAWSAGLMPCGSSGKALLDRYGGATKPSFDFPFIPNVELFLRPTAGAIQSIRGRLELPANRRRIVFSARMMSVKRPDLALAAFAAIAKERPEWDLIMLGDGELRSQLEISVPAQLRPRVLWPGFLNDPLEVAGLYALSDVLLLPSDHEPWGVVVVEASAAGMAIVVSDVVGASPELVHEGRNGLKFPVGDLDSLAAALRTMTHPERIDVAKQHSREVLREWLAVADPVRSFCSAMSLCSAFGSKDSVLDRTSFRTAIVGSTPPLAAGKSEVILSFQKNSL